VTEDWARLRPQALTAARATRVFFISKVSVGVEEKAWKIGLALRHRV